MTRSLTRREVLRAGAKGAGALGASAVMLGYGFVIAFDTSPLDFRDAVWIVPVVQALVAAPFVVRILTPALRGIDPRLREVLDAIEVGDGVAQASERAGLSPGDLRAALGRLEAMGLVRRDSFGGYERAICG